MELVHSITGWDSWVNFPLAEVDPNTLDCSMGLNHPIDIVLGIAKHSKVGFPLMDVGSKKIGYFLEPNHFLAEWD